MINNLPKIIKEHHEMMIEKGFFECPKCKGIGNYREHIPEPLKVSDLPVYNKCKTCKGTGIDPNKNIGEMIMQIVSEIGEAYEAHRNGRFCDTLMHDWKNCFEYELADIFLSIFNLCGYLKEEIIYPVSDNTFIYDNVGEELLLISLYITKVRFVSGRGNKFNIGTAYTRLLTLCKILKIDIEQHILAKMEYNKTRPYKHNKRY